MYNITLQMYTHKNNSLLNKAQWTLAPLKSEENTHQLK